MLLWGTFLQAEHTEVYTSAQSKLHLTWHLQLTNLTQRYEGGLVCISRQQSKGETLSHQLQTTNMHEQRWRTVYNLLLRGAPGPAPWISVLVLSCCSDLKKKKIAQQKQLKKEQTRPSSQSIIRWGSQSQVKQLLTAQPWQESESNELTWLLSSPSSMYTVQAPRQSMVPPTVGIPTSLMQSTWPSHWCILGWSPKSSVKLRTKINYPYITWESVRKGRYQIPPLPLFPEFS